MSYSVSQADIDAYNRDGAVPLRGVVSPRQLTRLAAASRTTSVIPGLSTMAMSRTRVAFTAT